jgi:hypothetical protein
MAGLTLMAAGCAQGTYPTTEDIQGFWVLESVEVGSVVTSFEIGINTYRTPWVEIGSLLTGSGGCNDFNEWEGDPFTFSDGVLIPGEILFTAVLCSYPDGTEAATTAEAALQQALWWSPEGFRVELKPPGMVWIAGDTRLLFSAAQGPPPGPPMPPETGIGRLDCLPGVMVRESLPDTGWDGEQILRAAVPNVVTVQTDPPGWFWWGYEASGAVVAAVAKGDIVPVIYELFTCTEA